LLLIIYAAFPFRLQFIFVEVFGLFGKEILQQGHYSWFWHSVLDMPERFSANIFYLWVNFIQKP